MLATSAGAAHSAMPRCCEARQRRSVASASAAIPTSQPAISTATAVSRGAPTYSPRSSLPTKL